MNLVIFLGTILTVSQLVLGRGNNFKAMKEKHIPETTNTRVEPPEEKDDTVGAFQSDMLLLPEQLEEIVELIAEQTSGVHKRKATSNLNYRWPENKVMYELDSSSEPDRDVILAGMNLWTQSTCVQFVPYSAEVALTLGHDNRVQFFKGEGCYSWIGMLGLGIQQLSIGEGCTQPGTVAHELGHALGWHHEHSRPDRDEHVFINFENVQDGAENDFDKYSAAQIATHDVPYDVASLMHYGSRYFSSNGEPTIVALDPIDEFLIANRNDLSFYDIKLANLMFNCAENCGNNLQCQNEGFVGEECTCVCKLGYSGDLCETFQPQLAGCVRELTDPTGILASPGYPAPYENYQTCVWKITGAPGTTISLSFTAFQVEYQSICSYDKVIVRADNITSGGQTYCGNSLPPDIESTGNQMLVAFLSDSTMTDLGFQANYVIRENTVEDVSSTTAPINSVGATTVVTTIPAGNCDLVVGTCGGTFLGSGCFASPNYGNGNYNNNEVCVYDIEVAQGQRVEIILVDMDIQIQSACSSDRLEIDLGGLVYSVCGSIPPTEPFVSTTNAMQVRLISDGTVTMRGFAATYQAVSANK